MSSSALAPASDDETRFTVLVERHRRELQVHCYRILGSYDESQDAVQDTFLRVWRSRATARGAESGGNWRAWLHKIATHTCLDRIGKRTAGGAGGTSEVAWLQPYPDALLDVPDGDDGPDAVVIARETIGLAFLAAVQHLPTRQRAVLLLRDVLGWRAAATADVSEGRAAIRAAWTPVLVGPEAWGEWRCLPVEVNRQVAMAAYLRPARELLLPDGLRAVPGPHFAPCTLDVLRIEDGLITEVTTFGPETFGALGLPGYL